MKAGYTVRAHNRWFSNWVSYRERISRDATGFRTIRLAPKRIVFEMPTKSDNLRKSYRTWQVSWPKVLLAVFALSILAILTAQLSSALFAPAQNSVQRAHSRTTANASNSSVPELSTCVDFASENSGAIVSSTEAFSVEGWHFESQSKLVSLGQLASAEYSASCMSVAKNIRVLFIAHGKNWQIEKMAPTQ